MAALLQTDLVRWLVAEADIGGALLIVFSDGVDTPSWLRDDQIAETMKRADLVTYDVTLR